MESHQLVHGRLEDVHFPELLLEISRRKESGVLNIQRHRIEKDIYFQDGSIIFAKSNDPDERLGELLLRRGIVTYDQLDKAAQKIGPGIRLGTVLVQDGFIKPNDLYHGVIEQVEEILYTLFDWFEGEYQFQFGALPSKEVITLSISTPDVIMKGIQRIWRWSWIQKGAGSLDRVLVKATESAQIIKKMEIPEDVKYLLIALETPRSIRDLLESSTMNHFESCKWLWIFQIVGAIKKHERQIELKTHDGETQLLPFPPEVTADIFDDGGMKRSDDASAVTSPTVILKKPPQPETKRPPVVTEELPALQPSAPTVILSRPPDLTSLQDDSGSDSSSEPTKILQMPVGTEEMPGASIQMIGDSGNQPSIELSFSDFADLTDAALSPKNQQSQSGVKTAVTPRPELSEKELLREIRNLNEKHRYIFEMLRIELGSSVTNFFTKTLKKMSNDFPMIWEGAQMNEFGEFNEGALMSNIQGNLADNFPDAFKTLLDEERKLVGSFFDRKRVDAIESGLARIDERQRSASGSSSSSK